MHFGSFRPTLAVEPGMSFRVWCVCHLMDVKRRADAAYQDVLRARCAKEIAASRSRYFAEMAASMPWPFDKD